MSRDGADREQCVWQQCGFILTSYESCDNDIKAKTGGGHATHRLYKVSL